jgi:hypothetical protein
VPPGASETDFTDELSRVTVPTVIARGGGGDDDDQILLVT